MPSANTLKVGVGGVILCDYEPLGWRKRVEGLFIIVPEGHVKRCEAGGRATEFFFESKP